MACVPAIHGQEEDTCVPVCSFLPPALCRGNTAVRSSPHNNEEKWTRGCFITSSSAPMPRCGLESKHPLCFGGCKRKSLSLTQLGSFLPGYNGGSWKLQQESQRRSLTHVLLSGSLGEAAGIHLGRPLRYRSRGSFTLKVKMKKRKSLGAGGVITSPEWSPILFS